MMLTVGIVVWLIDQLATRKPIRSCLFSSAAQSPTTCQLCAHCVGPDHLPVPLPLVHFVASATACTHAGIACSTRANNSHDEATLAVVSLLTKINYTGICTCLQT